MSNHELELDQADQAIVDKLNARRPLPAPSFRGMLARRLAAIDPGYSHRPAHLWARASALAGSGLALLIVGLLLAKG